MEKLETYFFLTLGAFFQGTLGLVWRLGGVALRYGVVLDRRGVAHSVGGLKRTLYPLFERPRGAADHSGETRVTAGQSPMSEP